MTPSMIARSRDGEIAVLTLCNPPVNATSQALRLGLLEALQQALADDSIAAVVLIGDGDRFSAGGDVRELGNPALNQPSLRDTIAVIEASPKPVIAAMAGIALGGGLELALGCHWRVGRLPLRVGLPEVTLGVIPGAGGTQRLPRLTGPEAALDIITSGRHVDGAEALALGVIDALVDGPLLEQALQFTRQALADGRAASPVSERGERLRDIDPELFKRYRLAKAQLWQGQLAPWLAADAIEFACTATAAEGMAFERRAYLECQPSPQRAALGYLFAARRATAKAGLAGRADAIEAGLRAALEQAGGDGADPLAAAGRQLLQQGLALTPSEIDVVAVDRLGFPAHCGGPMYCSEREAG